MSLASSAYNYKIRSPFLLFTKLLQQNPFLITSRSPSDLQRLLRVSQDAPCYLCNQEQAFDSDPPLLGSLSFDLDQIHKRATAALSPLLLLLPDLLGETLILQSCSTGKGQARAAAEFPNMPTDDLSAKRTKVIQAHCEKGGHHLHRGSAAS